MKITFDQMGDFEANSLAEEWCRENGISFGPMQRGSPRGLMYGDVIISKWRNLTESERKQLDGTMNGNGRTGPIIIQISGNPPDKKRESKTTPEVSK